MSSFIRSFRIEKLFNRFNVDINFEYPAKVLIGENGIGKTTVFNALYYTLATKFDKLKELDFEKIDIEFKSGRKATIIREHITKWEKPKLPVQIIRLKRFLNKSSFMELLTKLESDSSLEGTKYEDILGQYDVPISVVNYYRQRLKLNKEGAEEITDAEKIIKSEIYDEDRIMYLPTYRRIEADTSRLTLSSEFFDKDIQFGMKDIEDRIKKIENDIINASREEFSKISAEILREFAENKDINDVKIDNYAKLAVIVDRIGDLPESEKSHIKKIIKERDFEKNNRSEYMYFLSKLIKIHENQKEKENSIKKFIEVCNDYLINKEFRYNESSVKLRLFGKGTDKPINLNQLSSGEKQIVSLFSRIYLEDKADMIVLIDEPELSLSIEWQKKLLPFIYDSGKCSFLLAVTHSPFIFKNELFEFAVGLDMYMEDIINGNK